MRRTFQAMIVAAAPMLVAAWAHPAAAEPWGRHHHYYHGGYWHCGYPTVYARPWYPNYGLIVVVRTYTGYSLSGLPATVREVRLHEDERPAKDVVARTTANVNSGQPRAEVLATSLRVNPEPTLGTAQPCPDEPFRAFLLWLFPPLSLWASL
jgi:hypothetical protein